MGRKPSVNSNLPPHMRKRKQRSGKVYYYFDTGEDPRIEIPLGSDYITALQKYAALNIATSPITAPTFGDVIKRYIVEHLPTLAKNTIRIQQSDIKHVQAYFDTAPLDQMRPFHIRLFLTRHKDKPTTATRCKRLISTMWNLAREWDYTPLPNPCAGIIGYASKKRTVYITDEVFNLVRKHGSAPLQDALDLAYLTGQRPDDVLHMTEHDIIDGHLIVTQGKTMQPLRIMIQGELEDLLIRINKRKEGYDIVTGALLVNTQGRRLTQAVLRKHFVAARNAAAEEAPEMANEIKAFWFYDLRAKAADDTADERGDQAASNLLGHDTIRTTQKHYLRRGKKVEPTR